MNNEWCMIKEEKPSGFSKINLKIFPKEYPPQSFIINHSSLIKLDIIKKLVQGVK
jgi:hypothetical protein